MKTFNPLSTLIFIVILGSGGAGAYMAFAAGDFGDADAFPRSLLS